LEVPDHQLEGIYAPHERPGVPDVAAEVRRALQVPLGTEPLSRLARGKRRAVLVVDDATRAVPNSQILPPLLAELQAAGLKENQISVLVARGLHRRSTPAELRATLGEYAHRIKISNHEPDDPQQLVFLGRTRLGTNVYLNKEFLRADLKILVGDVEYHQFAGYGGGAKSVYPGLADRESIRLSHSRLDLPGTGPGRLQGNPVREEIDEVGRMAGVDFGLNVVLNSRNQVVRAFAGDLMGAFQAAVQLCDEIYKVQVPCRVGMVIASAGGYPKDIDLYQAQKALEGATRLVRKGGKVILLAECREGHGSPVCYEWMSAARTLEDIFHRIREAFVMGGHKAYQLARELAWAKVYLLSAMEPELVRKFFLHPLQGTAETEQIIRAEREIAVLPQATSTLILPDADGARNEEQLEKTSLGQ